MKVTKEKKKNVSRSKLFGIVINPKVDEMVDWKSMSSLEMENKLKELRFPDRFVMTDILNQIRLQNVNKNYLLYQAKRAVLHKYIGARNIYIRKT